MTKTSRYLRFIELNVAESSISSSIPEAVALVELGRDREALIYLDKFLREAPPERYAEDIQRLKLLAEDVRKRLH